MLIYDVSDFKILAFPCNQFNNQEPGDSQEICEFINKKNVSEKVFLILIVKFLKVQI
jgi:glutathione peroxidase-family protein